MKETKQVKTNRKEAEKRLSEKVESIYNEFGNKEAKNCRCSTLFGLECVCDELNID